MPIRVTASILAAAIALALAGGFLNALLPLADSLSHFRFHLSVALLAVAAMLLFVRLSVFAVVAVVLACLGIGMMYPALPGTAPASQGIKFIQFNTLFNNPRVPFAIEWLNQQAPDVLALQEVSTQTVAIYSAMRQQMPSHLSCKFAGVGDVAILSKFRKLSEKCAEKLGLVWMQVEMNGRPATVASLHLHWPYPYRQWQQLESLRIEFESMPRPILLTGDFNAAPWSETLNRIQKMTNTKVIPGFRLTLRKEFPVLGVVPFLPLDHFLVDSAFSAYSVANGPQIGSDHLPVVMHAGRASP